MGQVADFGVELEGGDFHLDGGLCLCVWPGVYLFLMAMADLLCTVDKARSDAASDADATVVTRLVAVLEQDLDCVSDCSLSQGTCRFR